jgi:hypothetical protein
MRITAAQDTLVRPEWDTDNIIDMNAALRAQDALAFSESAIQAMPNKITACLGDDGVYTLKLMGLLTL